MKKTLFLALVAGTVMTFTSCKENKPAEQAAVESEAAQSEPETSITVIEQFLIDSIAPGYAKAQYSIPCVIASDTDESNPDETLVWGDFWVFNYDIAGDTLKTVSGGSHPGLMPQTPRRRESARGTPRQSHRGLCEEPQSARHTLSRLRLAGYRHPCREVTNAGEIASR